MLSKREQNAALTRDKLMASALALYAGKSIDGVSFREIAQAAGQRNSNALQYHFGDRAGLLQAIVDKHGGAITGLRETFIRDAQSPSWSTAEAAARCLVEPIIEYVESNPQGLHFVKLTSQLTALYQNASQEAEERIHFPENPALLGLFETALSHLPRREMQRRIYLVVSSTFHSIAEIYRASEQPSSGSAGNRRPMVDQLLLMLSAFFAAASLQ